MEPIFDRMQAQGYEQIVFCQEKTFALKAIIVIHDTTLGPAMGGMRMWPYENEEVALNDALRLARGMTYKNAVAGVPYGGGKGVILGDPRREKDEGMLCVLGRFIHRLSGLYWTGVDVGTTVMDMEVIRTETPYVVTVSEALGGPGDTSSATAYGVFQGIRACLEEVYGLPVLEGRTVAVQGVGVVGAALVDYLAQAGAHIMVADVDQQKAQEVASGYHMVQVVQPEEIHRLAVDVYCPCALGGGLNDQTLPALRCKIVCGGANNQLAEEHHGVMLTERDIVYAPDYIVNAGGIIVGAESLTPGGFQQQRAMKQVERIYQTMRKVLSIARERQIPTYQAANTLAEQRLTMMRQVKQLSTGRWIRNKVGCYLHLSSGKEKEHRSLCKKGLLMPDFLQRTHDLHQPGLASVFDQVSFWSARFGAFLFNHLPLRPNLNILDLACGTGFPLFELAQVYGTSCQVTGIDIWKEATEQARSKQNVYQFPNVMKILEADAVHLPFQEYEFDLIVSNL
jgi:leucine dehydrogenase